MAGGLPADRTPRIVQLLRGFHPHHRFDVQPAREVAEGDAGHFVATTDRIPQLPAVIARVEAGPQRFLTPGPWIHRPRHQQETRGHPRLPGTASELPASSPDPPPPPPNPRKSHHRPHPVPAPLP